MKIPLSAMTTVEAHSCLLNMHVTFYLAEIEELMPQQARKQLEAELGTSFWRHSLFVYSYFGQSSPVQSIVQSSPVQSPGFTETPYG